jgi:glycosyltransferase involved in cell wall biosynthesis
VRPTVAPPRPPSVERAPPPSFSVIIGAFQAAGTIREAVESVLCQTYPASEVIVCDDGSTDGTADVLAAFAQHIVCLRKPNGGGASALNACLRVAKGDFVSILDADDALEPQALEALAELAARRPDLDILQTDAAFVSEGATLGRLSAESPFAVDDQRLVIFDHCFVLHPAVRRSRLLDSGGFDESFRIVYDWDCWIRLLLAGSKAGLCVDPLYRYRVSEDGLSAKRLENLRERVSMLEKVAGRDDLEPTERSALSTALERHRRSFLLADARDAARTGRKGRRRRALAVVGNPGFSLRTRSKALAACVLPRTAARRFVGRDVSEGSFRLVSPVDR